MASDALLRVFLELLLYLVHTLWFTAVNSIVPEAYLDEVFHVPQAQAYWAGNWTHYDPKITTPAGLYGISHVINCLLVTGIRHDPVQTTEDLRNTSAIFLVLLYLSLRCFRSLKQRHEETSILSPELNITLFPLFLFFSALYYTDLLSALLVMISYVCWAQAQSFVLLRRMFFRCSYVSVGIAALVTRQTNIFWVAIFMGGLQLIRTVSMKTQRPLSLRIAEASIEDYVLTIVDIVRRSTTCVEDLFYCLAVPMMLLGGFGYFVFLNGGVVMGDKENHIATLHLPQMLYIWPFITFFSWPLLLPQLLDFTALKSRMPRPIVAVIIMVLMVIVVHFNTIVHPFTLADNRHYMFYIFRLLLWHPLVKYAAVPVYYVTAWLVINALGGTHSAAGERISFVLVWLVSTALSLITAPLVEPRYFMVPWLMWRLHIPDATQAINGQHKKSRSSKRNKKHHEASHKPAEPNPTSIWIKKHVLWIELAWFLLINGATCWLFLNRPFEWVQEPGKLQRFMW